MGQNTWWIKPGSSGLPPQRDSRSYALANPRAIMSHDVGGKRVPRVQLQNQIHTGGRQQVEPQPPVQPSGAICGYLGPRTDKSNQDKPLAMRTDVAKLQRRCLDVSPVHRKSWVASLRCWRTKYTKNLELAWCPSSNQTIYLSRGFLFDLYKDVPFVHS